MPSGTQNYICAPAATATGVDWLFIGPQATLFNDSLQQAGTHYQSRNPQRNNAIQATWQDSGDTSAVWATRRDGSLDANYVAPGAIEWLVLDVSGAQLGPTAGNKLSPALYHPTRQHPGGSEATVHGVHAGNAEHAQAGALRGRLLLLQITPSPSVRQTDSSVTASHRAPPTESRRLAAQPRAGCVRHRSGPCTSSSRRNYRVSGGVAHSPVDRLTSHGAGPPHGRRSAEQDKAGALVKVVREATERFQDVAVAEAEGYALQFGCVSGSDSGAMGLHLRECRAGRRRRARRDAARDRDLRAAAERAPEADRRGLPGARRRVERHAHRGRRELMGQLFHLFESPNRFGLPAFYTLHVWAWKTTPTAYERRR